MAAEQSKIKADDAAESTVDHHEVKIYYDGTPIAVASGPTPCAKLLGNLLTEMACKGLAAQSGTDKL